MAALLALSLAGCGSGGGDSGATNSTPPPTTPPPAPPPGQPSNSALLEWNPSTEPSAVGYRVYYGTAPRTYQQPHGSGVSVGGTSYLVTGLAGGTRYYFAVTNYDDAGNESDFSEEVSKVIP